MDISFLLFIHYRIFGHKINYTLKIKYKDALIKSNKDLKIWSNNNVIFTKMQTLEPF